MQEKITFTEGSVQETLLPPLWGRARYSKKYPELLNNPQSQKFIKLLDYDFDKEAQKYYKERTEYYGLIFLARARNFDFNFLQKIIKLHN